MSESLTTTTATLRYVTDLIRGGLNLCLISNYHLFNLNVVRCFTYRVYYQGCDLRF